MGNVGIRGLLLCVLAVALCACSSEESDSSGRGSGVGGDGDAVTGGGSGNGGGTGAGDGDGTGSGTGSGSGIPDDFEGCASADINAARVKPTVWFVVDGSGSMDNALGGSSRWDALRSALMDPDGVVQELQAVVEFGLVLYNGPFDIGGLIPGLGGGAGTCPEIITVAAALDNFGAIDAAYPAQPLGGSTPTHWGMDAARMQIMTRPVSPDNVPGPQYIVLATDGAPNDNCGGGGGDAEQFVIDQTGFALDAGIETFVISLAGDDQSLTAHLTNVTTAGGTGTSPFLPETKEDLVSTLTGIVGGAVGCEIVLNGEVTEGSECLGIVDLNGNHLPCNDPNGWMLVAPNKIELVGQACDDLLADNLSLLHADFPCDVFAPE